MTKRKKKDDSDASSVSSSSSTSSTSPWPGRLQFCLVMSFSVLGSVSFSVFLFLIPFTIDPAVSALLAEFGPEEAQCVLTSSRLLVGMSQCKWSSCSEGCTRDLYRCFQLEVNYTVSDSAGRGSSVSATGAGFLFINVRGCGYPPWISCERFYAEYASLEKKTANSTRHDVFPCYPSKKNASVVVPEFDRSHEVQKLALAAGLPCLGIAIASCGVFCIVPRIFARYHSVDRGGDAVSRTSETMSQDANNFPEVQPKIETSPDRRWKYRPNSITIEESPLSPIQTISGSLRSFSVENELFETSTSSPAAADFVLIEEETAFDVALKRKVELGSRENSGPILKKRIRHFL